jgi:hypothetical protein
MAVNSEGVFGNRYEFICSIRVKELRDQLNNYQLIKMNYASGNSVTYGQLASHCCYVRNFGLKKKQLVLFCQCQDRAEVRLGILIAGVRIRATTCEREYRS